ncbi:MAG: hypothetical protein PHI06_06840 [Desulfobulbaceae bacterium]|nr:hypothetical protein [Desulfobulbaceae bacterium]
MIPRGVLRLTVAFLALLLLVGGWCIPFYYESSSILYKFGLEKIYLRSGKMVGITVVLLVFFQVIMAGRLKSLEQIFSVKNIFSLHRINGTAIALLACLHPLLIKASEDFTAYTFDKKYYPEFLGIALLSVILLLTGTAVARSLLKISYASWLHHHRWTATIALLIIPTHVLWVSETFKSGVPRTAALTVFTLALLLAVRVWRRRVALELKTRLS